MTVVTSQSLKDKSKVEKALFKSATVLYSYYFPTKAVIMLCCGHPLG